MAAIDPANRLALLEAAGTGLGDAPEPLQGIALALREAGDTPGALRLMRRAIALDSNSALGHYNLGIILYDLKRLEEAVICYRRALGIDPDMGPAFIQLIKVLGELADWSFDEPETALRKVICDYRFPLQPFTSLFFVDDRFFQLGLAERFSQHMMEIREEKAVSPRVDRSPASPLRVGFFTSDMHDHPVAKLFAQFLELMDNERFETFVFDYGQDDGSVVRQRISGAANRFVTLGGSDDETIERALFDFELDILIDLKGHTGTKAHLLAGRPAPVQVGWLGYPGTSGAPWIDHILVDSYLVPPGWEQGYSENVIRLPDFYCPYDTTIEVSSTMTREDHGFADDDLILCSFCQVLKIRPTIFAAWMDALLAEPRARLWLPKMRQSAWENLQAAALNAGVDPNRIVQAKRIDAADHLGRYRLADLALDTYPYASHTTSLDALFCGCPLLACAGESFASRVAGSALTVAGLPEFIAEGATDYREKLLLLVREPERMRKARDYLATDIARRRLFDTADFTRNFENVLDGIAARLFTR